MEVEEAQAIKTAIDEHNLESLQQLLLDKSPEFCGRALYLALKKEWRDLINLSYYFGDRAGNEEAIEIAKTKNEELVRLFLDHGADVNVVLDDWWTPFQQACRYSASADVVKLMIDHGADLELDNLAGNLGIHPVQMAFLSGDKEKIDLFSGMLNAENVNQWELLSTYVQNSNPQEEIMSKLLQIGASVNGIGGEELPVLYRAILNRNLDCLKFLIKSGANVNERGSAIRSLLHSALENHLMEAFQLLLRCGADPNLGEGNLISTALRHYKEDSLHVIGLLLTRKVDINKHENDRNPLSVALELGHEEVCKFLIRKIILMKAQDLYVSDENLHASDTKEQYCQYQKECVREMELLNKEKFKDSSLSYFDIFEIKNVRKLASLARNENIVQILKSDDFNKEFPIYGNMISGHFSGGVWENEDFELLKRFVDYLSTRDHDRLPKLPFSLVCELFTYLSYEDIYVLREL